MRVKKSVERDWLPYMQRAVALARDAEAKGDVPVGAVLVDIDGKIVAEGHNERELVKDPTAHAEMIAIRGGAALQKAWRLTGHTLVVTLEPCVMCAGALSLSRIDRVVFGARDPKAGAMGSLLSVHADTRLNHLIDVVPGVLEQECRELLVNFFKAKRE
jgi:tRNA(adenine34) deaminase